MPNSRFTIADDLIFVTPLNDEVVLKTREAKHTIPRGNFEAALVAIGIDLVSHVTELIKAAKRDTLTWLAFGKQVMVRYRTFRYLNIN